jgi:hypothetical protein
MGGYAYQVDCPFYVDHQINCLRLCCRLVDRNLPGYTFHKKTYILMMYVHIMSLPVQKVGMLRVPKNSHKSLKVSLDRFDAVAKEHGWFWEPPTSEGAG